MVIFLFLFLSHICAANDLNCPILVVLNDLNKLEGKISEIKYTEQDEAMGVNILDEYKNTVNCIFSQIHLLKDAIHLVIKKVDCYEDLDVHGSNDSEKLTNYLLKHLDLHNEHIYMINQTFNCGDSMEIDDVKDLFIAISNNYEDLHNYVKDLHHYLCYKEMSSKNLTTSKIKSPQSTSFEVPIGVSINAFIDQSDFSDSKSSSKYLEKESCCIIS